MTLYYLLTLIKSDLDTILLGHEVGHLLLDVIAVLEYLRSALELRHPLEHVDTLNVGDKLTHLIRDLRDNGLF